MYFNLSKNFLLQKLRRAIDKKKFNLINRVVAVE